MAPNVDDRWLWLGLGVFSFIAFRAVSHGLHAIVTLTEVHQPPPKPSIPAPSCGKEDAIKTSSLQVLASCSNVEIRRASTKILCDRFWAHEPSRAKLLKDRKSSNPAVQRRAQLALELLRDNGVVQEIVMPPTPRGYRLNGRRSLAWLDRRMRTRTPSSNPEERDLRRRRREAMVINEGDRPISQQDVWMRDGEGHMSREEARDAEQVNAELRRIAASLGLGETEDTWWLDQEDLREARALSEALFGSREEREDSPSPVSATDSTSPFNSAYDTETIDIP